jgi:hypothetical protein
MEVRYAAISEAARTRAIVSLGVSMFVSTAEAQAQDHCYDVHTYNMYLSCADSHVVVSEPDPSSSL